MIVCTYEICTFAVKLCTRSQILHEGLIFFHWFRRLWLLNRKQISNFKAIVQHANSALQPPYVSNDDGRIILHKDSNEAFNHFYWRNYIKAKFSFFAQNNVKNTPRKMYTRYIYHSLPNKFCFISIEWFGWISRGVKRDKYDRWVRYHESKKNQFPRFVIFSNQKHLIQSINLNRIHYVLFPTMSKRRQQLIPTMYRTKCCSVNIELNFSAHLLKAKALIVVAPSRSMRTAHDSIHTKSLSLVTICNV